MADYPKKCAVCGGPLLMRYIQKTVRPWDQEQELPGDSRIIHDGTSLAILETFEKSVLIRDVDHVPDSNAKILKLNCPLCYILYDYTD
jgi:hypothetical protein